MRVRNQDQDQGDQDQGEPGPGGTRTRTTGGPGPGGTHGTGPGGTRTRGNPDQGGPTAKRPFVNPSRGNAAVPFRRRALGQAVLAHRATNTWNSTSRSLRKLSTLTSSSILENGCWKIKPVVTSWIISNLSTAADLSAIMMFYPDLFYFMYFFAHLLRDHLPLAFGYNPVYLQFYQKHIYFVPL